LFHVVAYGLGAGGLDCPAAGRGDGGFDVEYFFYCRDRPGSMALRWELAEEHWSFMDRYAGAMIARGPTLAADESIATGSVHFVDLPDADAARAFAFEEPNYRAGVYDEVLVRRWRNMLGRTMWDFAGEVAGDRRFLIIGHGKPGLTAARDELRDEHCRYIAAGGLGDRLIASGPLLSDDGSEWLGTAMLAELPDRASAEAILAHGPYARAGLYDSIEVHGWQFGGRPQD
jgi:uncharacterized protein